MSAEPFHPVVWRGRDLSGIGGILRYNGVIKIHPVGRSVVLLDLEQSPNLDELLAPGRYEVELRVVCRLEDEP
jgi:hypothetical protein